jgi:5-formyltetrahydrofolate cyclo-ligase
MNNIREEEIKTQKASLRKKMLGLLRGQEPSLRTKNSLVIRDKVLSSREFRQARTVMTYVSLATEVDTFSLNKEALEKGKRVVVPFIDMARESIIAAELTSMDSLVEGPFGIFEPKDGSGKTVLLKEIDLVVVPAIAYDRSNMRLGRGKGYYDRFLSGDGLSSAKTIGIAFGFQIVDFIPSDPHDRPVQRVVTELSAEQ